MSEEGFLPGTILAGRYQVRRELGRGGMGVVYLCRDLVIDERVAVKLLDRPGAAARPEDAWWFQEEARALAGLSHPALVKARDFGALANGTPYLVMDAVPGRSLHEWLYLARLEDPLPWPIIWSVIDQVLGALAHAHARGVIHGDLKPSNVLVDLQHGGEPPIVHVLDLGLAWLIQDRIDHRLDGSRESEPTVRWGAGTPGWMAPEQIRFAAPHVGPATDLYALGCILYALLAGGEVYDGSNDELLQQHRSAPIPDLPLPPEVPGDVAKFAKRLLAKRPWHRFDFAGDARRVWKRFEPRSDVNVTATPLPIALLTSGRLPPSRKELLTPELLEPPDDDPPPSVTTTGLLALRPSPFVARTGERARLMEVVAEMVDAPKAMHRFVLLAGEAGVGKSRLAEWLCEEVHERALMVPLRARYRRIAAPLDGVLGAVTQHYRLERAEREIVEKVLMNLWEVPPEDEVGKTWVAATAEWIKPSPPGSEAVGPTGKRFRLDRPELRWLIIRKTLERIGRDRPVLLWLDDLHYASSTTFEGLLTLHRDAPNLGLLVVATVRSEAVESDPVAAKRLEGALAAYGGERLDVAPLNPVQTHALLRETLPLDDAAAEAATARSKGNPLFALQLLHAWAGGGHLQLRAGKYFVPRGSMAVQAATTADLWEERLAALPEELRAGARAAAALGGDIRREILREMLTSLDIPADRAIASMQRAQILLAVGDRLRWPHALLQEHLLSQLFLEPDAARVFRAAADALGAHPAASSRRILRHRVVSLLRAGDTDEAAALMHAHVAAHWQSSRDIAATLRDLAVLDGKLPGGSDSRPGFRGGGEARPVLTGTRLGTQLRFRAEALRLAGRLEEARRDAEDARRIFEHAGDRENQAHCLRLLGHIASDVGAEAQGRRLVARAHAIFDEIGHRHGQAQCEVLLGEIDFQLGEHARARAVLASGEARFLEVGDRLGRAQCLLLQSMVEQAGALAEPARALLTTARADFDAIGYRLGLAQCELTLSHVEHRLGRFDAARTGAIAARQSFRDLANPRGEAGCERLLSMVALDAGAPELAEEHALAAGRLYETLADPWGLVEARLLFAQISLHRGDAEQAREHLVACEAVALAEAEPRQHRHLTLAWLAYHEGRFHEAARELDAARASFKDSRTGDHTPQLLERFARMGWPKPAGTRISGWMRTLAPA
ncbi:protein kinase [Sorangium sp. So ce291]|uniref:serine/threonine-protein kinase n=1 Tax=Sorangium sp. So ce291 TaxID=3133294 RepID=UPI003F5EC9BC